MPQDGHQRSYLLQLVKEVWRFGSLRAAQAAPAGGGESTAQKVGCGLKPGQANVAGCAEKKALRPSGRRPDLLRGLAKSLITDYRVPIRRACKVVILYRSLWYYSSKARDSSLIRKRMREIAQVRIRYGYLRIFTLLRREGWPDNHKRVYKLYKEEGLNLRSKRPKRNKAAAHRLERLPLSIAPATRYEPVLEYRLCSRSAL